MSTLALELHNAGMTLMVEIPAFQGNATNGKMDYLLERAIMTAFRTILTREAERVWKDGKDKMKRKLEHLERKWRNNPRPEVEGVWRGIKIGDKDLEEEMADEENKAAHKYGGVESNADEDALLALPHKFTTFENIQMDKIKVSTEIMKDKI